MEKENTVAGGSEEVISLISCPSSIINILAKEISLFISLWINYILDKFSLVVKT